jgi:predicted esterase/catechol 2,3-dioxygenase-like lactoylglutathione lyase family enzyme
MRTTGIHHITAIASAPQKNLDFYTGVLGMRLVKRTVNFDDPSTYHFYFADHDGSPGSILTFFPWPSAKPGVHAAGAVDAITLAVPPASLDWWHARLQSHAVRNLRRDSRFGAPLLAFEDHDTTRLELIESPGALSSQQSAAAPDSHPDPIPADKAIRGFFGATIVVRSLADESRLLRGVFGMEQVARDPNPDAPRARFRVIADDPQATQSALGQHLDVVEAPNAPFTRLGAGIVHHIAMRARDDADHAAWRDHAQRQFLSPTPIIDRSYFRSIYFREPQGVLFEIATDNPGFATDEHPSRLGHALKLPPQYESQRARIEAHLPALSLPQHTHAALSTHRHLFLPAQRASARTLILLHGTGGDEHQLVEFARRIDPGAAILAPRGNADERGAARYFRRLAEGVFDLDDLRLRVAALADWLQAAALEHHIDLSRATFVGYSNGATTAAATLLLRPGLVRSAVLLRAMHPVDPPRTPDLNGTRVLMLSGQRDRVIPIDSTRKLDHTLQSAGATVRHESLPAGHELTITDADLASAWLDS